MKSQFLMSCAVAAVFSSTALAAPAWAADAPQSAAAEEAAPAEGSGDIIVTATRRNESIQKVPLTIQAFSGATLGALNVKNFNDLVKYTPNVTFGNNGPGAGAIFLRGLSTGFAGTQSGASIAPFPNVALYLDDQSLQFPGRNADIYVADLERVEVLEGPQGTLFGGGAQAGAVRYITNKPKLDAFSGHFEGSVGGTIGGAANASFTAVINAPIIKDKLAIRAVIYSDHRGGYIDNVPGTLTRSDFDRSNRYLNNGGRAPLPSQQTNFGQYDNAAFVEDNFNPADYVGGRLAVKWQVTDDWDVLVTQAYQKLSTRGTFAQLPFSPDQVVGLAPGRLSKLQTVSYTPNFAKDELSNTAWTVNGKVGPLNVVYTGAYTTRKLDAQQDYSNYLRAQYQYYQCTGAGFGGPNPAPFCYSPFGSWRDKTRNTHHTQELRISTPVENRIRLIAGAFYEKFLIQDDMRFNYRTVPACNPSLIAAKENCLGLLQPIQGATLIDPSPRGPETGFGQDLTRGYTQYAGFASVDFDILENLTITGGTRYFSYNVTSAGSQYGGRCFQTLICANGGPSGVNIDAANLKANYKGFRSRASITWKPSDEATVYATFSQGFRAGGFNRASGAALRDQNGVRQYLRPQAWEPDDLNNYEIGVKTNLFDRRLQFNLSGYYMQWKRVQFLFFNPTAGLGNTAFVTNGADFDIKGVEAQFTFRPDDHLTIQGGATYNNSRQVSSPCFIANNPASVNVGNCITQQFTGPFPSTTATPFDSPFGSIGSALPFAPQFQGNLRVRYDWVGASELNWFVSTGVTYTGVIYNQPDTYTSGTLPSSNNLPGPTGAFVPGTTLLRFRQPGYALVDLQIGVKRDGWSASIFGDNITNSNASTFTSTAQYIKSETVVRPTTYGLRLSFDY
jgi:iron complex outermembrane recepter protein